MVVVTPAETHHVDAVVVLVEEMDRHYGSTEFEPLEQRIAQITDALFGDVPAAFVLLAWEDDRLLGLASYSFLWPAAGVTRSLYLKELVRSPGSTTSRYRPTTHEHTVWRRPQARL